ncbi:MAG: recombination-associated protein RdgC [Desulfovibrio sp.]|nr:recombination-associated protein RdgC [Desulfovibrio sp.]
MSKTTALTVFQVDNPAAVTAEVLKRHAFRDGDANGEKIAAGWTSMEDMLDTSWERSVPEVGDWLCFAIRADKRSVSAAVLKKSYNELLLKEKKSGDGEAKVSRMRKKELRVQAKAQLLARAIPVPTVTDVALDTRTGNLFVGSVSTGILKLLNERMSSDFNVTVQQFTLHGDAPRIFRTIYDVGADVSVAGHTYRLEECGRLTLSGADGGADKIEVSAKNDRVSADAGLDSGLAITSLKVRMERDGSDEWTFELRGGETLCFSGLKTPAREKSSDDTPDSVLLEKLHLIEQAVNVVHTLFEARAD